MNEIAQPERRLWQRRDAPLVRNGLTDVRGVALELFVKDGGECPCFRELSPTEHPCQLLEIRVRQPVAARDRRHSGSPLELRRVLLLHPQHVAYDRRPLDGHLIAVPAISADDSPYRRKLPRHRQPEPGIEVGSDRQLRFEATELRNGRRLKTTLEHGTKHQK